MDKKVTKRAEQLSDAAAYLKRPYARIVIPEDDKTFRGEILEFPGCIAVGNTAAEAFATLEEVAESWIETALAQGQKIPEPLEGNEFSGKLVLRLPRSLHKKAARAAQRDGVSLNQFMVSSLAEQIGERSVTARTVPVVYPMIHGYDVVIPLTQTLQWSPVQKNKPPYVTTFGSGAFGTYPVVQNQMKVRRDA